jgi:hypothetical protein
MGRLRKRQIVGWARGQRRISAPVSIGAVAVAAVTTVALTRSYDRLGGGSCADLAVWRWRRGCSDYFKVSGIGTPIRSKASRWAVVGSASMGTVAAAPAKRTSLRVMVARWSMRPWKL